MEVQGWVVVGLTLILLGYLVPHLVRSRRLLLDSRLEDRFSAGLRVLPIVAAERGGPVGGPHHTGEVSRPYLHRRRTEAAVKRPTTRTARAVADARVLAAARAARAREVSRRAAAARRRLILTLLLVGAAAVSWSGVGLMSLAWWVAAAPTAVLAGVLVAGRRAAVAGRRRDAVARTEMALLEAQLRAVDERVVAAPTGSRVVAAVPRPAVVPRTVEAEGPGRRAEQPPATAPAAEALPEPTISGHGAEVVSERGAAVAGPASSVPPPEPADDVPLDPAGAGEAQRADTPQAERADTPQAGSDQSGRPWTPVAVPPPAYTLKPSTRRRDVAPFEVAAHTASAVPARPGAPVVTPSAPAVADPAVSDSAFAADPVAAGGAPAGLVEEAPAGTAGVPAVTADAPGIDLDAVLRRRAEGA